MKIFNHYSMYPDLFADSHLLTKEKPVSECYVMERFIGTVAQWSVYYKGLLENSGGLNMAHYLM